MEEITERLRIFEPGSHLSQLNHFVHLRKDFWLQAICLLEDGLESIPTSEELWLATQKEVRTAQLGAYEKLADRYYEQTFPLLEKEKEGYGD